MIMAFDEGAWHPGGLELLLVLVAPFVTMRVLALFVARKCSRGLAFAAAALPFLAAYAFIAYFDYGNSGSYTGDGSMGPGASLDLVRSFWHALPYAVCFGPIVLLLAMSHWSWLKVRLPGVFWLAFALLCSLQLLGAMAFLLIWFEQ